MYSLSVDSDERSALVVDAPIDNGYDEEDDEILSRWLVAPEHLRPWQPFEPPSTLWPEPRFDDFSNGARRIATHPGECSLLPVCDNLNPHPGWSAQVTR